MGICAERVHVDLRRSHHICFEVFFTVIDAWRLNLTAADELNSSTGNILPVVGNWRATQKDDLGHIELPSRR